MVPKGLLNHHSFQANRRFLRLSDLRQMRAPLKPCHHNYKFKLCHLNLKFNLPRRSLSTTMFRRRATTLLNAQWAQSGNLTLHCLNLSETSSKFSWPIMPFISQKRENLGQHMSTKPNIVHSIADQATQSMIAITSAITYMISTMLEK